MRPLGKKSITLLKDLKEDIHRLKDKAYTWTGGPTIVNMSMILSLSHVVNEILIKIC